MPEVSVDNLQKALNAHDFLLMELGIDPATAVSVSIDGKLYTEDELPPETWNRLMATRETVSVDPRQFVSLYKQICLPAYNAEKGQFRARIIHDRIVTLRRLRNTR